jgi:SAM-dependent methyltransferase
MQRNAIWDALHVIADEWMPPVLRDSRLFHWLAQRAFGNQVDAFAALRERSPALTAAELKDFYTRQLPGRQVRVTDNTEEIIQRICEDVLEGTLCDVGCGTGHLLGELQRRRNLTGIGIDLNIDTTGSNHDLPLIESSIEKLPFPDNIFDTVICTHTLEHVLDAGAAGRELKRIARRRLIVVVPAERPYRWSLNAHLHFFAYPYQLALTLQPHGRFTCERVGHALYYREDLAGTDGLTAAG